MHTDELAIDEVLVRRLLSTQFPVWAELPLARVLPAGTDNAIFRLGDTMSVRMARRNGPKVPGGKDLDWLPRLAPLLPLQVPTPLAQGVPSEHYPWYWSVYTWVEGETQPVEAIDPTQAARDLAGFIAALQSVDGTEAPSGRGVPLVERDKGFRYWLSRVDIDATDAAAISTQWENSLAAPVWDGPPLWHHGDLDVRNWLVRDRRLSGVVDWDCMGVGDPACDVMVAWKLHSAEARDAFHDALKVDDATWARARGWVLSQAVAALGYYTPSNNPILHAEAIRWLELVLSERS
jgi:aminoglycoside phosphotransferase (APT) family kinase protein